MISETSQELNELPDSACPNNEAVAIITLHPEFLAKSYYPHRLLRELDLKAIGSRPHFLKPRKWTRKREPEPVETTSLFVAGKRNTFEDWATNIMSWNEGIRASEELPRVEIIRAPQEYDRIKSINIENHEALFEVALHADSSRESRYILEAFEAYCDSLGMKACVDKRMYVRGLCFMPVKGNSSVIRDFSKFSYLRVVRPMPSLRPLTPVIRSIPERELICELPELDAMNSDLHAAVFDGGYNDPIELSKWVNSLEVDGIGSSVPDYKDHGTQVTSTLLFGALGQDNQPEQPYCKIDNYRVLDSNSGRDDDLFDVLHRIKTVLDSKEYQFVNFSIGPEIPIEDDEVHSWTAVLDDKFSDGNTLATIAVGNGGERDSSLEFNRIQVPADCVNALAVGAANKSSEGWSRASYSSIGPGRSPGVIKPDLLAFGGSKEEDFKTLNPNNPNSISSVAGTSFAAPNALRIATGIRAHFGELLNTLAIKGLLIHCTENANIDRIEMGWGRLPSKIESIVTCRPGEARIVYQGTLNAGQYLRARIPIPEEELEGNVNIKATFTYSSITDPDHPGNYTRSGLDITFRPHSERYSNSGEPTNPLSDSFFKLKDFSSERELRNDAHKWETTLHQEKTKRGSSLKDPVFDIHYNARRAGASLNGGPRMSYALVITVTSPQTENLYDKIVQRYPTQIRPLQPVINIPIQRQV